MNNHSIQNPFLNALDVILQEILGNCDEDLWSCDSTSIDKLTELYECDIEILDDAIKMVQKYIDAAEKHRKMSASQPWLYGCTHCEPCISGIVCDRETFAAVLEDLIYVRSEILDDQAQRWGGQ